MHLRKLDPTEVRLIELLISKARGFTPPVQWEDTLLAREMSDGQMGSLRLFPTIIEDDTRKFGKMASEHEFFDSDGIMVFAALYLDKDDQLFELDVWKTDFSPLKKLPNALV